MGFLDWLRPSPPIDATTATQIAHAVAAVDPLLATVASHERMLAEPVRAAWAYCERLAEAIPGPFAISRAAFASDPLVHALFGSADDIERMLATSECLRDYIKSHPLTESGQCHAMLGMRPHVTSGFGTRISGDIIRRDEPQKVLTFGDHTLAEPGPDLAGAHQHLARAMFAGLLKGFVAHVDEVREERQELRDEQAIARARARIDGPESHTRRLAELQERLRATVDALQPANLLETLAGFLVTPEAFFHLEPLQFAVDRFGVLMESDAQGGDTLRFVQLTTRDQRRWVVMTVQIAHEEARAAVDRFERARRYIVI